MLIAMVTSYNVTAVVLLVFTQYVCVLCSFVFPSSSLRAVVLFDKTDV